MQTNIMKHKAKLIWR